MRLTSAYASAKAVGTSDDQITSDIRARLVHLRPSALEARGEPPLAKIGSLVYGVSDRARFRPEERLRELWLRWERELDATRHSFVYRRPCRRCQLLDVDTSDADALARVLGDRS